MPLITFDWFTLQCAFWLSAIAKCFDYSLLCTKHSPIEQHKLYALAYHWFLTAEDMLAHFGLPPHLPFLFLLPLAPPAQSTMVSSSSASPQLTVPVLLALDTPLSSPPRNQTPPVHYMALKLSFLALFVCDR